MRSTTFAAVISLVASIALPAAAVPAPIFANLPIGTFGFPTPTPTPSVTGMENTLTSAPTPTSSTSVSVSTMSLPRLGIPLHRFGPPHRIGIPKFVDHGPIALTNRDDYDAVELYRRILANPITSTVTPSPAAATISVDPLAAEQAYQKFKWESNKRVWDLMNGHVKLGQAAKVARAFEEDDETEIIKRYVPGLMEAEL